MDTEHRVQRGRPPLGRTRMVTIGIRVEPAEREQLEARASEQGVSLCAYLRDVIRRELGQREADKTPLRICQ
jgi:predicted HicB family RNase H-like nuclease